MPHLVVGGRRAVTIDFLGFGASDKPEGARYGFAQQCDDVTAVLDALGLATAVLVGHDADGPAALNLALLHPKRVASVVLMNAFYGGASGLLVPELIELFSHAPLATLARHFLASPEQFAWLVEFQRGLLLGDAAEAGMVGIYERGAAGPLLRSGPMVVPTLTRPLTPPRLVLAQLSRRASAAARTVGRTRA